MDRDLARHVLPPDHSARIFEHATAATGIISHNHRVSNNGIPREHVASATHANIIPVTLHNVAPSTGVASRERFERNGRTLTVFRPDVQQRSSLNPSTALRGERPAGNLSLPRQSTPIHDRLANVHSGPAIHSSSDREGLSQIAQPTIGSPGRPGPATRTTQPLTVRGPNSSRETASTTALNPQNTRHSVPLNSLVVIGQHRDSRVAAAQPDTHSSWNSHNPPSHAYDRNFRDNSSQLVTRDDDPLPQTIRPQTPPQPNWWAQPRQPRTSSQDQFRHNREMPARPAGNWNATVESPRYNPTPVRVPEHNHSAPVENRQHSMPTESRPTHSVPVESRQSRPVQAESHQSHSAPAVSQPSHSAPAPAPSSPSPSSSSHDTSSHSSGRGR